MGWIIFLLLIVVGVIAYRYLVTLEAEIRAEIEGGSTDEADSTTASPGSAGDNEDISLSDRLVNIIQENPKLLQSRIYAFFEGTDKREIQKELIALERSGKVSRVRSGSSYRLTLRN